MAEIVHFCQHIVFCVAMRHQFRPENRFTRVKCRSRRS